MIDPRGRGIVFGLLTLAYFMSYFFRSANAVIAPELRQDLRLEPADLGLMTSLFYAAFAGAQVPIGANLDRHGPRFVQPVLLCIAVLGSVLFALGQNVQTLAVARALLGAGLGGSLMAGFKAFSVWYPANRQATVTGLFMGLGTLGAVGASSPLGWLSSTWGWRSAFWSGAVLTVTIAVLIVLFVRNTPTGTSWPHPKASANLRAILENRHIWPVCALNFFMAGALLSVQTLWAGPYLFDAYRLEQSTVGALLVVMNLGVAIGYFGIGWLADRWGLERVLRMAVIVFIACIGLLALRLPLPFVPVLLFAFGLFGTSNMLLLSQARGLYAPELTGRATTFANMFGIGGTFLLQWLLGVIVGAFPALEGRSPPGAYSWAFGLLALGSLLAFVWYWSAMRDQT